MIKVYCHTKALHDFSTFNYQGVGTRFDFSTGFYYIEEIRHTDFYILVYNYGDEDLDLLHYKIKVYLDDFKKYFFTMEEYREYQINLLLS